MHRRAEGELRFLARWQPRAQRADSPAFLVPDWDLVGIFGRKHCKLQHGRKSRTRKGVVVVGMDPNKHALVRLCPDRCPCVRHKLNSATRGSAQRHPSAVNALRQE